MGKNSKVRLRTDASGILCDLCTAVTPSRVLLLSTSILLSPPLYVFEYVWLETNTDVAIPLSLPFRACVCDHDVQVSLKRVGGKIASRRGAGKTNIGKVQTGDHSMNAGMDTGHFDSLTLA